MTVSRPDREQGSPIVVFANPSSRGGKSENRFEKVKRLFSKYEIPFDFRLTAPGGETSLMVSRAIQEEGFRTVVYMGGDGTFNEVAKGVCASGIPGQVRIGMLPSGTANDQGKSFGIVSSPRAIERNVQVIVNGFTTSLDVPEITIYSQNNVVMRRDLFFDSVGWGLSAAILSFRNQELEIVRKVPVVRDMYRDHMVYVRAAARELALSWLTGDTFGLIIDVDGDVHRLDGLTDLVVSNTALYAGDWLIDPRCEHDDGKVEVVPFQGVTDWTSKLVWNHKKMKLGSKIAERISGFYLPTFQGAEIRGEFIKPGKKKILAQLDGEEFLTAHHFKIKVHHKMLRLIVPEDFHWI